MFPQISGSYASLLKQEMSSTQWLQPVLSDIEQMFGLLEGQTQVNVNIQAAASGQSVAARQAPQSMQELLAEVVDDPEWLNWVMGLSSLEQIAVAAVQNPVSAQGGAAVEQPETVRSEPPASTAATGHEELTLEPQEQPAVTPEQIAEQLPDQIKVDAETEEGLEETVILTKEMLSDAIGKMNQQPTTPASANQPRQTPTARPTPQQPAANENDDAGLDETIILTPDQRPKI
jgi:hypothetical protein